MNYDIEFRVHPETDFGCSAQRLTLKTVLARGALKIPILLLMLPLGLLLTITGMLGFSCLMIVLTPFYIARSVFWYFSRKGRIQRLKVRYQRRQQQVIAQEQRRRIKFSQRSDLTNIRYLVKLTTIELNKRQQHMNHILFSETKRRLHRCEDDMNIENALHIYSTLVDTELDSLNDALIQLFQ